MGRPAGTCSIASSVAPAGKGGAWTASRPGGSALAAALAGADAQLLELAVEVGALHPGTFRDPGHVAPFLAQDVFEIELLEGVPGFRPPHPPS